MLYVRIPAGVAYGGDDRLRAVFENLLLQVVRSRRSRSAAYRADLPVVFVVMLVIGRKRMTRDRVTYGEIEGMAAVLALVMLDAAVAVAFLALERVAVAHRRRDPFSADGAFLPMVCAVVEFQRLRGDAVFEIEVILGVADLPRNPDDGVLGVFRVPVDREGLGIGYFSTAHIVNREAPRERFALRRVMYEFTFKTIGFREERAGEYSVACDVIHSHQVVETISYILLKYVFAEFFHRTGKRIAVDHGECGDGKIKSPVGRGFGSDLTEFDIEIDIILCRQDRNILRLFNKIVFGRVELRYSFFSFVSAIDADPGAFAFFRDSGFFNRFPDILVRRAVAQVIIASREDAPDVVAFL